MSPEFNSPEFDAPEFDAFEHGRIQVGKVGLHYRRAGSGPPVLLLHGWPQHSLMWHAVAPILARRFTVICPDLRGAGASTIARGSYDKTTMAQDVHGLVDQLGLGPVNLAGYDLGAGVAAPMPGSSTTACAAWR